MMEEATNKPAKPVYKKCTDPCHIAHGGGGVTCHFCKCPVCWDFLENPATQVCCLKCSYGLEKEKK